MLFVSVLEFLDDVMVDACNKFNSLSYPVMPTLFLEFHGTENSLDEQVRTTGRCETAFEKNTNTIYIYMNVTS